MEIIQSVLESLHFDLTTFLVQIALFFAMHQALRVVLYAPLMKVRDERDARTAGRLAEAARINDEALALKRQWDQAIKDARTGAQSLIADSRSEAERGRAERVSAGREEARGILEETRSEIASDRQAVESDLDRQVQDLSVAIASRLVGASVDDRVRERALARIREAG